MAGIKISARLLAAAMFPGADVTITGARFLGGEEILLLSLAGPGVPAVAEVQAVLVQVLGGPSHERQVSIRFEEAG